jgi:hypothetical protein
MSIVDKCGFAVHMQEMKSVRLPVRTGITLRPDPAWAFGHDEQQGIRRLVRGCGAAFSALIRVE